jgi:hypothetical protein
VIRAIAYVWKKPASTGSDGISVTTVFGIPWIWEQRRMRFVYRTVSTNRTRAFLRMDTMGSTGRLAMLPLAPLKVRMVWIGLFLMKIGPVPGPV